MEALLEMLVAVVVVVDFFSFVFIIHHSNRMITKVFALSEINCDSKSIYSKINNLFAKRLHYLIMEKFPNRT